MTKKFNAYIILVAIIILTFTSLSGCRNSKNISKETENKSSIEKIKDSGKIVIGTCADYPPYEFHKQIDGKDEIVGFDIEIAKEIAKDLDVELEIKDMDFKGLLGALQTGNVDFIIAGMTPTTERAKSVDFTKKYYEADQGFLIRTEDKEKYKSIEELKGMKVGAQKGTIQEEVALNKIENAQLKSLGKITDLVLELKNKKIEGIVLVKPVAEAYVNANPDLCLSYISFGKEDGVAIAVKKGNKELVDTMNKTIDRLVENKFLDNFIKNATMLSEE